MKWGNARTRRHKRSLGAFPTCGEQEREVREHQLCARVCVCARPSHLLHEEGGRRQTFDDKRAPHHAAYSCTFTHIQQVSGHMTGVDSSHPLTANGCFTPAADWMENHKHTQHFTGDFTAGTYIYHSEYTPVSGRYILMTFKMEKI